MGVKTYSYPLRLPEGLKVHLQAMAKDQDRSVNGMIVNMLKKEIIEFRKEQGEHQPDLFDHGNTSEADK